METLLNSKNWTWKMPDCRVITNRVVCENKMIVAKPVQLPKGSKVVVFDKTLGKWVYNNEEK